MKSDLSQIVEYLRRYADRFYASGHAEDGDLASRAAAAAESVGHPGIAEAIRNAVDAMYGHPPAYTFNLAMFGSMPPGNDPKKPAQPAATPAAQPAVTPAAKPAETTKATAGKNADGTRYVAYGDEVKAGGSAAWRNNNPGNLRAGDFATRHGAIGTDPSGFAIFPSADAGSEAQKALIQNNYADSSVKEMVSKYAPASDNNDPDAYTKFLQQQTKIDPSTKISALTADQLSSLTTAMSKKEGTIEGDTYSADSEDNPDWADKLMPSTES